MDVWNIESIKKKIVERGIAFDREAISLARWIFEDVLQLKKGEEVVENAYKLDQFENALQRLKSGEPVQYIAGHAWFFEYRFEVNPNVLIPRPETEELVDWILSDYKSSLNLPLRILDIGTGSGCIAITLKKKLGDNCRVVGIDISRDALHVAKKNSLDLAAEVEFFEMDFLQSRGEQLGQFDLIVSNPPYVGKDLISPEIIAQLAYEPDTALYPSDLDVDVFYNRISEFGGGLLDSKGVCYLELNEFRTEEIKALFLANHWKNIEIRDDMQGFPRMLKAYSE